MNCPNCGAAMRFDERRRHCVCEHCGGFAFPESATDEGISAVDGTLDWACPVCAVPLHAGSVEGQTVAYCTRCRGILTGNAAFSAIVRARRAQPRGAGHIAAPIDSAELERRVHCPRCAAPLEVHPYYGPGNVVVDSCAACRLLWLDHGELTIIERAL